jgi:abequosyltransferase
VKLSIVIPTYNRPEAIVARVAELLPQLTEDSDLTIIDNCSDVSVESLIIKEIPASAGRVRHIRNLVNIGGNANICRCFEVGSGDWMWLLGDDDFVRGNAVSEIHAQLEEVTPSVGYISFSTSIFVHAEERQVEHLRAFTEDDDVGLKISNLMFISSGCYRMTAALPHMRMAYQMIYSYAPQIAVIALILAQESNSALMSPRHLVDRMPHNPNEAWSHLQVIAGFSALLDISGIDPAMAVIVRRIILDVRWRPFLGAGIHYIFNESGRPVRFWWLLLARIFICGEIKMKFRSSLLLTLLPLASFKWSREIVKKIINCWITANVNDGNNRL